MIIKADNELTKLDIFANGTELASIMGMDRKNRKKVWTYPLSKKVYVTSFKNPILTTNVYEIAKCNPTLRDTLFALYASRPRIVEYDKVSVYWDDSHINVWCPSIDTLFYAKSLRKLFNKRKDFKNVVEIGCGSGFLGKYTLQKLRNVKKLWFVDINKYAIKCTKDNVKDKRAYFKVGDGLKFIKGKKFDLIICNPPYVPRQDVIEVNPYEGVSLLYHLVHNGQDYLNKNGVIITNVSSLCWDLIFNKKPKMKMEIMEEKELPLKVNNILNNKKWLDYLKKKGLKRKNKKGYEYWQKIFIIKLENGKI